MTKVMSELLAIQKELRTAKQEIQELQSAKHDMRKELNAVKEQISPFKVSPKDKSVWLKGWNLHVRLLSKPGCKEIGFRQISLKM